MIFQHRQMVLVKKRYNLSIHLNNGSNHIMIKLKDIIPDYPIMQWESQRIIWIGFYKNQENEKCMFGSLMKEIIKYIIQFLI